MSFFFFSFLLSFLFFSFLFCFVGVFCGRVFCFDLLSSLLVLGTMGEGLSLTVDERKDVTEAWVKACKDK